MHTMACNWEPPPEQVRELLEAAGMTAQPEADSEATPQAEEEIEYLPNVETLDQTGMSGFSHGHLLLEGGDLTKAQKLWVQKKTGVFPDTRGLRPSQRKQHDVAPDDSKARSLSLKGISKNFDAALALTLRLIDFNKKDSGHEQKKAST